MNKLVTIETSEEASVDLTPMLDVVFIMLIFFIVTAVFVKETGVEVTKPPASTSIEAPPASVLVAIDAENRIWVDKKTVDIRALPAHLERLTAENPDGGIVIQADEASNIHTFSKVLDESRKIVDPSLIKLATKNE